MRNVRIIESPIGRLTLVSDGTALTAVVFGESEAAHETGDDQVLALAQQELAAYFAGTLKAFTVPLAYAGTDFQRRVWQALLTIPFGEKVSYQDVAIKIGNPKAVRAVGHANNQNPIPIIIPCHRVLGKNGSLVGYGGGLAIKQALLDLEVAK